MSLQEDVIAKRCHCEERSDEAISAMQRKNDTLI